jgi:HAE1 family hydrophobic/amphiphilic exporter-1
MLKTFIHRPVLSTVVSCILILLGLVGIKQLAITRFPEIAPPSVVVSLSYPGANAETVAESALLPLEEAINGVEGMTYIQSTATNSGSGKINVYFKAGTDPNQGAVNVQTRVSKGADRIPSEVNEAGITVMPRQSGVIMTINLYSTDQQNAYDETFLQAYSQININRELLRINGVAEVSRVGARDYAMRVWLDPEKLAAHDLVPQDVITAIKDQNFEIASGKFGETSDKAFETIIKYSGRLTTPEEFSNIVIKTKEDGTILYLKDIARVELGASNLGSDNTVNGHPGLTLNITQTSGSNAREIDMAVREKLKELAKSFPPHIHYDITYSVRDQIDESINQITHTLLEAFVLVFLIVLLFLQNFRATLIPAIAIPVSLVGTMFFLLVYGYSINILTMFALVLAIGIVVDDAIVVVEAVHKKMETSLLGPRDATVATMGEITPAILSITLVMAAVFLPIGFMEGPAGVFYRQFAYTLATAILLSALCALTLSPALCALILRRPSHGATHPSEVVPPAPLRESSEPAALPVAPADAAEQEDSRWKHRARSRGLKFFSRFNDRLTRFTRGYIRGVRYLVRNPKLAIAALILVVILGILLMGHTPTSFIPTEDDGFVTYTLKMPPGATLSRTTDALHKAEDILKKRPEIANMTSISGYNALDGGTSAAYAVGYLNMYPYSERKGITHINRFMDTIRQDLSRITEASVSVFPRPTVQGFGDVAGLQFVIQDKLGGSFQAFGQVADSFLAVLNRRPEILSASTSFQANFPQYRLRINQAKAKAMGVSIKSLMTTIRDYYGRVQAGDFTRFGRQYRVYMQAGVSHRETPESFKSVFAKNDRGEMVPVSTLVEMDKQVGPEIVNRYNLYNAVPVNATPADGYSTGDAMHAVQEVAQSSLPGNYQLEWTGISRDEQSSATQTTFIILLSILFVYFILSALYESYLLPLAILLSVPIGLLGVFGAVNMAGLENNIYVQLGLIMLIGLLAKNAILIVEYAVQQRARGLSLVRAALRGAELRLRPILMTSLAFVMGLVPLMWTTGPSAIGNRSISVGAAGGMIAGVFLGIFIIPVLFIIFKGADERLKLKLRADAIHA